MTNLQSSNTIAAFSNNATNQPVSALHITQTAAIHQHQKAYFITHLFKLTKLVLSPHSFVPLSWGIQRHFS